MLAIASVDVSQSTEVVDTMPPSSSDALFAALHALMDSVAERYRGSLYSRSGDGATFTFEAVVDGVYASIALLEAMGDFNASAHPSQAPPLYIRIGLIASDDASLLTIPPRERDKGGRPSLHELGHLQKWCPTGRLAVDANVYSMMGDRQRLFRPASSPALRDLGAYIYVGRQPMPHHRFLEGLTDDQKSLIPPIYLT